MTANSEHVEILRRGPRPWNEWRAQAPSIVPNLVGVSLSVGDRQLGPINGGPIDLAHARLAHAFLQYATLTGANLEHADLTGVDLRGSRLEGANLTGADLRGAFLDAADFAGANFSGANIRGVNLAQVRNLTKAQLHEAEGDATTLLPDHLERPLIWTVGQVIDMPETQATEAQIRVAKPAPIKVDEAREEVRPPEGEYVSWLVGGPASIGRRRRTGTSFGETGGA